MTKYVISNAIVIDDTAEALKFYADLLDLEPLATHNYEDVFQKGEKLTIITLQTEGGDIIELYDFGDSVPIYDNELQQYNHIAFGVTNFDELFKKLEQNEVVFDKYPELVNGVKTLFCRDFSGNLIKIVEIKNE